MVRRRNLNSRPSLFVVLMVAAALSSVLPARWTSWLRRPFQLLHLVSQPVTEATAATVRTSERITQTEYTKEEVAALVDEVEALRLQVLQQQELIAEHDHTLQELTWFRQRFPQSVGEIIIGRVDGFGTDAKRELMTISPGSLGRVREGDWVTAGLTRKQLESVRDGRSALFRRWLVGRVVATQPKLSHVQLVTDPGFQMIVVPAGQEGRSWRVRGPEMVLKGIGNGRMVVESATADYLAEDATVLLSAGNGQLPARMVVGRIIGSEQLIDSPLHYRLDVEPWAKADSSTSVFVVVPRDAELP